MSETNEGRLSTPIEGFGVSSRRRGSRVGEAPLRVKRTKHPRQVEFSIHPDTIKAARFRDREKMSLFMSSDRVNQVGLSHVDRGFFPQFRDNSPNRGTWTTTFRTTDLLEAFATSDGEPYEPQVEVEEETGTLWFPLPYGRSLHILRPYFGYAWHTLDYWICDSFSQQIADDLCFRREPGDSGWLRLEIKRRDDGEILGPFSLDVPDDLLQDPIRNGSPLKEHGFNPWNEDQQTRIRAHVFALVQPLLTPGETQPTAWEIAVYSAEGLRLPESNGPGDQTP